MQQSAKIVEAGLRIFGPPLFWIWALGVTLLVEGEMNSATASTGWWRHGFTF